MTDLEQRVVQIVQMILAQQGQARHGTVASVNPSDGTVRVTLDEDGTLSGWLPIAQAAVGNGWSMVTLPPPGTQVFMVPDMGDQSHMVVIGAVHSTMQPIGQVVPYKATAGIPLVPGEPTIMGPDGQFIRFPFGGGIQSRGTWMHDGDLKTSGQISDLDSIHGTLDVLRQDYDAHKHPGVQPGGGTTGTTDHPTP